jgi:predicted Fe-S protein YdhL (DUF1289 family)
MSSNPDSLSTPCTRNCCLTDDDICLGCFRSINEITLWTEVDDNIRQEFLNNADSRKRHFENKVCCLKPVMAKNIIITNRGYL